MHTDRAGNNNNNNMESGRIEEHREPWISYYVHRLRARDRTFFSSSLCIVVRIRPTWSITGCESKDKKGKQKLIIKENASWCVACASRLHAVLPSLCCFVFFFLSFCTFSSTTTCCFRWSCVDAFNTAAGKRIHTASFMIIAAATTEAAATAALIAQVTKLSCVYTFVYQKQLRLVKCSWQVISDSPRCVISVCVVSICTFGHSVSRTSTMATDFCPIQISPGHVSGFPFISTLFVNIHTCIIPFNEQLLPNASNRICICTFSKYTPQSSRVETSQVESRVNRAIQIWCKRDQWGFFCCFTRPRPI